MDAAWADEKNIAAIYLHGSHAEGRESVDSDLDVAVLLECAPSDWQVLEDLRADLTVRLAAELGATSDRLDIVFLHQAPPAFCYRAIRPGRILWEADNHVRVHFEARLLAEYLDAQYFEEMHDLALRRRIQEGTFGYRPAIRHSSAS